MYPKRHSDPVAPVAELERWLNKVSASAVTLRKALDEENRLPDGFPKDDINALAATLEQAPSMSVEGALGALTYAGDKLEQLRQRWVVIADDAADLPEMPWRGRIDTPLALLSADVGAARAWYIDAKRELAEASSIPEALVARGGAPDLQILAEKAGENSRVSAELADELDQHRTPGSIAADNLVRGIRDVEVLTRQERIELGAAQPRVRLLDRLNRAAEAGGEYAIFAAQVVQAGADFAEIGFDLVHKVVVKSWIDAVREASVALEEKIKSYQWKRTRSRAALERASIETVSVSPLADFTIFRDQLLDGTAGPEMVVLPARLDGFLLGSPNSEPGRRDDEVQRLVIIPQPFALGRYAVTFEEYDAFCVATKRVRPYDGIEGRGRHPVTGVTWEDAGAWCRWLSSQTNKLYRLPSEAEWEYACRGTPENGGRPFCPKVASKGEGIFISASEANFNGRATYNGSSVGVYRGGTVEVDHSGYRPNAFGLWQMHGNVWEFCNDVWHDRSISQNQDSDSDNGDYRVVRGGSWFDYPQDLRSASRDRVDPSHEYGHVGFRALRVL